MINKPYWMAVGAISAVILSGCEPLDYRSDPEVRTATTTASVDADYDDNQYSGAKNDPTKLDPVKPLKPVKPIKYEPTKYGDDEFGKSYGSSEQNSQYPSRYPGQYPDDSDADHPRRPSRPGGHRPGGDSDPDSDYPPHYPDEDEVAGVDRNPSDLPLSNASPRLSCRSSDPRNICLNLKYVIYRDRTQQTEAIHSQLEKTITEVNQIWNNCGIEFQLDQVKIVDPLRYQLRSFTADYAEFSRIRETFQDNRHFLVVATSNWNRNGSLGNTHANAWTTLPGEKFHGVIVERRAAYDPNVIAHELGHYLSLDHHGDKRDLMSAIIYSNSQNLTAAQCGAARSAAKSFWKKVMQ